MIFDQPKLYVVQIVDTTVELIRIASSGYLPLECCEHRSYSCCSFASFGSSSLGDPATGRVRPDADIHKTASCRTMRTVHSVLMPLALSVLSRLSLETLPRRVSSRHLRRTSVLPPLQSRRPLANCRRSAPSSTGGLPGCFLSLVRFVQRTWPSPLGSQTMPPGHGICRDRERGALHGSRFSQARSAAWAIVQ